MCSHIYIEQCQLYSYKLCFDKCLAPRMPGRVMQLQGQIGDRQLQTLSEETSQRSLGTLPLFLHEANAHSA